MSDAPIVPRRARRIHQLSAWGVHLYTALGLVAAAVMAVLIVEGTGAAFRWVFVLMVVATLIDATDGALARLVRIKEVLPGFDGRRLDDLIDFLTFAFLPLLLIWRAQVVPDSWAWILLFPLLASGYGFSQVSAKTDDGHFLGFPSYWNIVAFYLYALQPAAWGSIVVLLLLALLTFVPSRYLYPSQQGRLNALTFALGVLWSALLLWVLWRLPPDVAQTDATTRALAILSLLYPAYYLIASWWVSLRRLWG